MAEKTKRGLVAAVTAILAWGLLPIYWRELSSVPAMEILSHRIVWSVVVTAIFLCFFKGWPNVLEALKDWRTMGILLLSGSFVGCNWLLYIWSVNNGYVIQSSLGYYINPLVNVLLGVLIFKDHLRPVQWLSVALAAMGVAYQIIKCGDFPFVALGLAFTFSVYGLLRKLVRVESLPGLFIETFFLSFPALALLLWRGAEGIGTFGALSMKTDIFLVGTGLVTSLPLLLFVQGARDLNLSTLGIIQYLSPTLQFLLGVFLFKEGFSFDELVTFSIIWSALFVYTFEGIRYRKATILS